jgi:cytosine/adenosine deaminase-related metal-dependent hydrolase
MRGPKLLKGVRFVLTMTDAGIMERTDIRVEDGRISDIGTLKKLRGDEVFDCSDSIIMPGLVNCHTHSSMVALRGLNDDSPLKEWLSSMWEIEGKLTGETAELASELAFLEMVRSGTTACLDMYEAFDAAKAADRVGIRMRNGPAFLSRFAPPETRFAETERFISEYNGHPRIGAALNVHAIYTNDKETISRAAEMSKRYDVPFHIHCSETREEAFGCKKEHGKLPVELLDDLGALWEKSILVHLGWASSWEFARMRERGASAIHCPSSNLKLGTGGFFPMKDLLSQGLRVGIGTDSAASNNSLDMFREMKEAALVQKGQYWDPAAVRAMDVLMAATVTGSSILGTDAGSISVGALADLVMVDIDPILTPLRKDTLPSALVYSANGHLVKGTMVGGEWVYLDGRLRYGNGFIQRYQDLGEKVRVVIPV